MLLPLSEEAQARIKAASARLQKPPNSNSYPRVRALAEELGAMLPKTGPQTISVNQRVASLFFSAAVEAWLRSVHSFMMSASLTRASPIWSSVAGYYSSHYAVRGLAHLLGVFLLFNRQRVVRLRVDGGSFTCTFDRKSGDDREHKLYWNALQTEPTFASDPLFPSFDESVSMSDSSHRNVANYADHLWKFPKFETLDEDFLSARIAQISEIEFDSPPIPDKLKFPDLDSVQIVAYHRLVRFRRTLDESLGVKNNFWNNHRTPGWAKGHIDFQLVEQSTHSTGAVI
jgi:hypothetical protein